MATAADPVVTEEECLALAETSNVKLDVGGRIRMMAGGTAITARSVSTLDARWEPRSMREGVEVFLRTQG